MPLVGLEPRTACSEFRSAKNTRPMLTKHLPAVPEAEIKGLLNVLSNQAVFRHPTDIKFNSLHAG